ncbi:unnamed protein product [Diplocarpon coronariae]|nr:hypothetical protein JHW43_002715 [Diplocarpon mali]
MYAKAILIALLASYVAAHGTVDPRAAAATGNPTVNVRQPAADPADGFGGAMPRARRNFGAAVEAQAEDSGI